MNRKFPRAGLAGALVAILALTATAYAEKAPPEYLQEIRAAKQMGASYQGDLWHAAEADFLARRAAAQAALEADALDGALARDGGSNSGSATLIDANPYLDAGNTTGKGHDASLPACVTSGTDDAEDAWYVVSFLEDVELTTWTSCADLGPPSYDTRIGVFDDTLTLIACNDDADDCGSPNYQSRIESLALSAGTYYVVVDGHNGNEGPYELNASWVAQPTPCNGSDSGNPHAITTLPFTHQGNTTGACHDIVGSCELGGNPLAEDYWYSLTLDTSVLLDVSTTCDSMAIDTRLVVLDSTLNPVYCNDDTPSCSTGQSLIEDAFIDAGDYYIVVDGSDLTPGNYEVSVDTTHADPGQVVDWLPDLITRESNLYDNDIVTTIEPGRVHLRLSNGTANIGLGKLYLYGVFPDNGDGTQDVNQRVYRNNGTTWDRQAGKFIFHETHGHIHVEDWCSYRVREVLPADGVGVILAEGKKVSFCVLDLGIHDDTLPNYNPNGEFFNCGSSVQGTSVGWMDIYSKTLAGQNIDVTDVPDGEYWLESVVDPNDNILESDESNNASLIKVTIGAPAPINPDPFESNDDVAGVDARIVGAVNSPNIGPADPQMVIAGLNVHVGGNQDYFKFYSPATGASGDLVRIDFIHGQGDLDMRLLDATQTQVASSSSTDDFEEISLSGRPEGWYYIRVFGYNNATSPDYTLTIDPPANGAPVVTVLTPPVGDTQIAKGVENYQVEWTATDPEGDETWVTLYLNAQPVLDGNEEIVPPSLHTEGALGIANLNSAEFEAGTYWIYAQITDGGTTTGAWSAGTLTSLDLTPVPELPNAARDRLFAAVPNPFNPATLLQLELGAPSAVSWRVYDVRGSLVRTIFHGRLEAGHHERRWDGRDEDGSPVSSGIYFNVLVADRYSATQKLVLLK